MAMQALKRNNVTRFGHGERTLLFAHGFGCDQSMWRAVAPAFAEEASIALFDLVGAGGSDVSAYDPDRYSALEGHADDLVDICVELDAPKLTYVGHSVGATIGVIAALKRPDLFDEMVLICPSPRFANTDAYHGGFDEPDLDELLGWMATNHREWSAAMAPSVVGPDQPELQQIWTQSVCSVDPAVVNQFARITFKSDHRAEFQRLAKPTLIIDCKLDSLAPPEVGAWVQEAIAGSRRVTLDTQGHCPHMTSPVAVTHAIRQFLADAPQVARAA
jgi:sigma-B regulation protein RsbQ